MLSRGPLQSFVLQRIGAERDPELVIHRKAETVRHDADDGVANPAEIDRASDDVWVAVEAPLPRLMADHHDG